MLQILQEIQATQNVGHRNAECHNEGGGNRDITHDNDRDRSRNRNHKTPDNAAFQRADKSEYCWTHSAYNNKSGSCNRLAPGHKNNEALVNRMGAQFLLWAIERSKLRMTGGDGTSKTI